MCQRYMRTSHATMPGGGARQRAEPALDAGQPARGGTHDHAREAEQDQQRRDVAEQHVLDHVRREQVVVAEAVQRRDERRQQRRACRRRTRAPVAAPGAAPARLLARLREAPDVDARRTARAGRAPAGRRASAGADGPSCHSTRTGLSQSGIPPVTRPAPSRLAVLLDLLVPPLCWSLRRAGPPRRSALPRLPALAALPAGGAGRRSAGLDAVGAGRLRRARRAISSRRSSSTALRAWRARWRR